MGEIFQVVARYLLHYLPVFHQFSISEYFFFFFFCKTSCSRKVNFENLEEKNLSTHAHDIQHANFSLSSMNSLTKIIHPNVSDHVEVPKMKNSWTIFLSCSNFSDSRCCWCFLLCDGHFGMKPHWLLISIALFQLLEIKSASLKWHFGRAGNNWVINSISEYPVFQGALAK